MRIPAAILATLLCASRATAATVTYTDRDAFAIAANPNLFCSMDVFAATQNDKFTGNQYCSGGACVGAYDGQVQVWANDVNPGIPQDGMYQWAFKDFASATFSLTSGEPMYAFGFDVSGGQTIAVSDGSESFLFAGASFIGLIMDSPSSFFRVGLQASGALAERVTLDNLQISTQSVPEPSTLLLFGVGALLCLYKYPR